MRKYKCKKRIIQFLIFMLMFVAGSIFSSVDAYEIRYIATIKDMLDSSVDNKDLLYRKEVSAYAATIAEYNAALKGWSTYTYSDSEGNHSGTVKINLSSDNWVYRENNTTVLGGNPEANHNTSDSFDRRYEFFHANVNSFYNTDPSSSPARYYLTGETTVSTAIPTYFNHYPAPVTNVWGETGGYSGFYDENSDGLKVTNLVGPYSTENSLVIPYNIYRYAVKNNVYVSDNILEGSVVQDLWAKFSNKLTTDGMKIYVSSLLRTKHTNGKYYQNMDTSYKFWETMIRGPRNWAWLYSPSTTGTIGWGNDTPKPEASGINYYDNTLVLPENVLRNTKIYVRHIDTTTLDVINTTTLSSAPLIITSQGKAFIHSGEWGISNGMKDRDGVNENGYSEHFIKNISTDAWRLANLKYNHNTAGSYWNLLNQDERNQFSNYTCIGAVVGKGDSLANAETARNNKINSITDIRTLNSHIAYDGSDGSASIETNSDATSIVVMGSEEYDYVVIDFYYDKNPTQIYVRHLDVSNIVNTNNGSLYGDNDTPYRLKTSAGIAFITQKTYPWSRISDLNRSAKDINPDPTRTVYTYQEVFAKPIRECIRVANIKYDNGTTYGSYWNNLTYNERNYTFKNYNCIGAVVGRGSTIDIAEANRDKALSSSTFEGNVAQFVSKPDNYTEFSSDAEKYITKNSNYTHVMVDNNNSNCIVIDFYYILPTSPNTSSIPPADETKYVYVRHINITGESSINANKIDNLINQGKILNGKGVAIKKIYSSSYNLASSGKIPGYQELYKISSGETLKISRDPDENYICVGSNMVSSPNTLANAKSAMNAILNGSIKYDTSLTEYRETTYSSNDVVIIDFYYRSKHAGTPIERTPVGRLGYYTVSSSEQFSGKVNNYTPNDNATVIDSIPSGEALKMSIDNAYTYMLGAINIKEQNIQDTYTIEYTITQNYNVKYKDWSSSCSGGCNGTSSNKKTGGCGASYSVPCEHYTCGEGGGSACHSSDTATCTGTWTATYEEKTASKSTTIKYSYAVPYKYTYYKVKNMRLYTISKIELLDGKDNNGLPLFESQTYTTEPKDEYNKIFSDKVEFVQSKNTQENNRKDGTSNTKAKLTMTETLDYTYNHNTVSGLPNNENGDISDDDIVSYGTAVVNRLYTNNVNHSSAAKMTSINESGEITNGNSLTATLTVNNDKYSFTDTITEKNDDEVIIVGNESESINKTVENSSYEDKYHRNEFSAVKVINLSKYTEGKTRNGNVSNFTYTTTEDDRVNVKTQYPEDTTNHYEPEDSPLTRDYYYNTLALNIPERRVNGKRYSTANIYYDLLKDNTLLNFDVKDSNATNGQHNWSKTKVVGANGETFVDTEMYRDSNKNTTLIDKYTLNSIIWEYGGNNNTNADIVNVFTPVAFLTTVRGSTVGQLINHSAEEKKVTVTNQIQKNAQFTIDIDARNHSHYSLSSKKYIKSYYIQFDFDVQNITITDMLGTNRKYGSSVVSAGTWIGPIYNQTDNYIVDDDGNVSISAFALADPLDATLTSVVHQEENFYRVRAVAYNAPSSLISSVARGTIDEDKYVDTEAHNRYLNDSSIRHYPDYYTQNNIKSDSNFVAEMAEKTDNISRIYDFKVTDLKDVDWKNIFRKSTTSNTNVHTNKAYYSGINKWNIYTTASNDMIVRDSSEIGVTKQQILPLGPYKNTNTTYVKAPKLGYRFSFDLKTTGSLIDSNGDGIFNNKKVVIEPKFYYVSKSGEYIKDIDLYYKNSSNKYVSIDNYNLYFVPDDGYRLTFKGTDEAYRFSSNRDFSKSTVRLGTANKLTLTSKMMEESDNMFVQIWYGEYKLPNSTIAVKSGENINNKLTNGYIGVKFDIKVYEYSSENMIPSNLRRVIDYAQDNRESGDVNTSQWDYEGYLGVKPGRALSTSNALRISLEDGVWIINNDTTYNEIKGTVILYDTDTKASSDYN